MEQHAKTADVKTVDYELIHRLDLYQQQTESYNHFPASHIIKMYICIWNSFK